VNFFLNHFFSIYIISWFASQLLNVLNCRMFPEENTKEHWALSVAMGPFYGIALILRGMFTLWIALMMTISERPEPPKKGKK